jgi:hypothetical protein
VRPMRLLVKFNLILILVFAAGMAAAAYFARTFLQQTAHAQVLQQARLMMSSAGAMPTYTTKQGSAAGATSGAGQYVSGSDSSGLCRNRGV